MKQIIYHIFALILTVNLSAQETRLLRSPDLSDHHVVFTYASDIWTLDLSDNTTKRLTSTSAIETNPRISPDGKTVAFTSDRSGAPSVYTVSIEGGSPERLTYYPATDEVRDWTPDGTKILYASSRETAPSRYNRLWTVSKDGGPSEMINQQWGNDATYSADGNRLALDRVRRWDSEWRGYRGGQNTPLIILDLNTNEETLIPHDKTYDIKPVWLGDMVYFLSDRDKTMNIWSYQPTTKAVSQVTKLKGADIKWLSGHGHKLVYERNGYLHLFDLTTEQSEKLKINLIGDFPWAETKWENVGRSADNASISPNAKRAIFESRGELFTVPVEKGNSRNITQSSGAADRRPIWSPKGDQVAWFSDKNGNGYELILASQDGLEIHKTISLGESKLGWEPNWSPDGKYIAYVDDDVRIKYIDLESETITTADIGGNNLERGRSGLSWSPDSKWLAYTKTGDNGFRQIMAYALESKIAKPLTNSFADAFSPTWDLDQKHLYFLASTDLALGSGWANTSAMTARPEYAAYLINLDAEDESPFIPLSDEEEVKADEEKDSDEKTEADPKEEKKPKKKKSKDEDSDKDHEDGAEDKKEEEKLIKIDFDNLERRTIALPMDVANYIGTALAPEGHVFIAERKPNSRGATIHKFSLKDREAKEFLDGVNSIVTTPDGKNMLAQVGGDWKVVGTGGPSGKDGKSLKMDLQMKLDRSQEWTQIFNEAWRYERDYFYDPNLHGRDWDDVYERYAPLVPFIKHRADLTYVLDQVSGELSVGHSFVFGGDYPETESDKVGLLGADFEADQNYWKITKIYNSESWNPDLSSPLDRPDVKVEEGNYLVGINGKEITSEADLYLSLDGTVGNQTIIHINSEPKFEGSWKETVSPIRSENALRQRAWVEDNRRLVDKLSNGRLAYIWVPNTSVPGFVSFNRYLFAQQDKEGAVIDERFNGGGLLDDYMVDLMTRKLRAAITNEVPNGKPLRLPTGVLGPKVLLINEMAGSGGDFFPWVFRHQEAGPLIGSTTWGGLVKSSVHYSLVDGGALTSPDNAVFDPAKGEWIGENTGIAPDIAIRQDAKSLNNGIDPQLERAVSELLKTLEREKPVQIKIPSYPSPAKQ
ncbi:S41 family peptidase [Portibacter lacus]|uniref:Tricorn protease homolog n=1 Tax=Portibacter lacus TaxID=1099794 RepID=A0AA37ST41_9BACT|nr:S41 family peptidase [Portibacter lacus]GLR19642.1 tricorn protease [Portibacter lacus]